MAKSLETYPVMKNGTFLGYADAEQIANNASLELYDERKAEAAEAAKKIDAAKEEKKKKEESVDLANQKGADPAAVKKAPAK